MFYLWQHNTKARWDGNIQWNIAQTTALITYPDTRINILVDATQQKTWLPNVSVQWMAPFDWMITSTTTSPAVGLVGMDRASFRRVFGRVWGRVN